MAKEQKDPGSTDGALQKSAPLRYVGPIPAARIGNLPGRYGTVAADRLTPEEIAWVIATVAAPLKDKVASWWTSD
jgi:hypothetical protein